jgi:hypothetical protein
MLEFSEKSRVINFPAVPPAEIHSFLNVVIESMARKDGSDIAVSFQIKESVTTE